MVRTFTGPAVVQPQNDFKHALRDWIEGKLSAVSPTTPLPRFTRALNDELKIAGLTLNEDDRPIDFEEPYGFVDSVSVKALPNSPDFLAVKLEVSARACGGDQTLYLYRRQGGAWIRKIEVDNQPNTPVYIADFQLSRPDAEGNRLFVVTRLSVTCTTSWNQAVYSVYRLNSNGNIELLKERSQSTHNFGDVHEIKLTSDSLSLRFVTSFRDIAALDRPVMLNFKVEDGHLIRTEPVATRASHFVDEWWSSSWAEAEKWVLSSMIGDLRSWHEQKLFKNALGTYREHQCSDGDLDVSFDIDKFSVEGVNAPTTFHFRVRLKAPRQFRMIGVSTVRPSNCSAE